jgi:trk system potassium uptake protein TrkH
MILVILMVIGGCAGSTGGGMKVIRIIIFFKSVKQEIRRMLHPKSVTIVQVNGRKIGRDTMHSVYVYFICYVFFLVITSLLLSINNFDFTTTFTASLTTLNNVGPGLLGVGPVENFSQFSGFSKFIFCINMLVGRLEIFPYLLLLSPELWKRKF